MKICTVCNKNELQFFETINYQTYWKCNYCDAKLLDKKNYINHSDEKKHYLKHNNIINDEGYRNFLLKLIKPLKSYISKNDLGLDYGCGYAPALVHILKKDGYKMEFYDPFFFPNKNIFLRKFNFITCTEVVEHFNEPHEEFKKIDNLLAYNSWFGVMTSFMRENFNFREWHYRRDPTHVVFYNRKTFQIIATQRNWNIIFPCADIVLFNKK